MTKILTIKELIKRINKLGEQQINMGLLFKNLALSIESRKDEKKLKDWKEVVKPYLIRLENETNKN